MRLRLQNVVLKNIIIIIGLIVIMPGYAHGNSAVNFDISYESNVECIVNDFDCERTIQKLSEINDSLKEIQKEILGSNLTNLVIIAISLVLSGVAIIVSIVTTKTAVEQVEHTKKEQKQRLRPILVRQEYFDFKDGLKRPHKVQTDKILFRITNKGPLTTTKVLMRWYVAIVQNKQLEFIRSSDEDYPIEGRPLPNLGTEESYSIDLFISSIHYKHIHKNTDCIFGVVLEYSDENDGKYEYRMDGYFDHGGDLMLLSHEEMKKMISLMTKNPYFHKF